MRISVFGLGYVGAVSAACLASEGHDVVGVDVSQTKVDLINAGKSPIIEEGIGELTAKVVANGNLRATTAVREAIFASNISLVCVGTPSNDNGSLKLDYAERKPADRPSACRKSGKSHCGDAKHDASRHY